MPQNLTPLSMPSETVMFPRCTWILFAFIHVSAAHLPEQPAPSSCGSLPQVSAGSLLQVSASNDTVKETDSHSQRSKVLMQVSELMPLPLMLVLAMCGMPQLLCWSGLLGETAKPKQGIPKSLPAISSLRYLAVLSIWFGHEYLHFVETSPFFAMISGFVLQFAEERRSLDEMDLGAKWSFFSRRFMRLYPMFALHVVTGSMAKLPWYPGKNTSCDAWGWLSVGLLNPNQWDDCGSGTWFIPQIIRCYAMFPWASQCLRRQNMKSLLLLLACSLYLAGTQPYHQWLDYVMTRFFIGMILVPIWMKTSCYPAYRVFSALTCNLGPCIIIWYGLKQGSNVLPLSFEVLLLLGMAGLCDNAVETTFTENPVLFVLSRPQLAWMGELALPLYTTNTLVTSFIDRNMPESIHLSCLQHDGLNGKPWRWENADPGLLLKCPGQEVLFLVATEFVVIHAAALLIYRSCAR